jgi:hypothetical protein
MVAVLSAGAGEEDAGVTRATLRRGACVQLDTAIVVESPHERAAIAETYDRSVPNDWPRIGSRGMGSSWIT